ncbi:60S ribosomal protein L28 [Anaeramoeba flamelloides]|uniref:60S ribosomal protein L28 n=1 Tax=Anaeramoeba flamelloides TaxID=1746091 RepID=A0AAV7YBB1_9EUKA|nr:60S ribosomal protein L28 [Anaeramoeba flamelloides]KAJ6241380.1 60S ribosomal protein L28 [Anaeramoeba flamelloides]
MTTYSDQFIWNIVRKQSSFKVQKKQYKFSNHPCSFNQKYNFTNSGIAAQKAVGLKKGHKGKGVILSFKKKENFNKPNKFVSQKGFETRNKESQKKVMEILKKNDFCPCYEKKITRKYRKLGYETKKKEVEEKKN